MKRAAHRRGMSIIEVLIGVSLAALLLGTIGTALVGASNSVRANDRYIRSRQNTNVALNYVLTKIRRAKYVELEQPGSGDSYGVLVTVDDATWDSTSSTWTPLSTTRFALNNSNELTVEKTGNAAQPVLRHVRNLSFRSMTAAGNLNVTVELTSDVLDMFQKDTDSQKNVTTYVTAGSAVTRSLIY